MKSIFNFDAMLTPKILAIIYWLTMLLILGGGVVSFLKALFAGSLLNSLALVLGTAPSLVFCRVSFELIMVVFKNNEYLRRIAERNSAE